MRVLFACLCAVLCWSCSNATPAPKPGERQIVVFSTRNTENVDALKQRLEPAQTATVDPQGTQMWSVDVADITELRKLESAGRLVRLHVEEHGAWPMLRELTPSGTQGKLVTNMIGAIQPSEYVIGNLSREIPLPAAISNGFRISVPLPRGADVELERPRQLDQRSWQFDIEGGVAAITLGESGLRGTVQTSSGVFLIRPLPNGEHVVYEAQRPSVPDEPPHTPPKPKVSAATPSGANALDVPPPAAVTCTDDTLRVLPLFTQQVEQELTARHIANVTDQSSDAARDTRLALAQNNLNLRIDILAPMKVTFAHSQDLLAEVATLASRANIQNDEIAKLRSASAADLVMLSSTAHNACGAVQPKILTAKIASANEAFFVVTPLDPLCAFTFTHETGHVLGMRHHDDTTSDGSDREQSPSLDVLVATIGPAHRSPRIQPTEALCAEQESAGIHK